MQRICNTPIATSINAVNFLTQAGTLNKVRFFYLEMILSIKVSPHYSDKVTTVEVWNENQLYLICYDGSFWFELFNS